MSVSIASSVTPIPVYGHQGPWEYGSALFVLAFESDGEIAAYKSTDDGATWAQTGTTKTIDNALQNNFGACASGDNIYCLYVARDGGTDANLLVSRYSMVDEDWDADSATGPLIEDGAGNAPIPYIALSADDVFGIMAKTFGAGSETRTVICSLSLNLATWSSFVEPTVQSDDFSYSPVGIAAGTSGRVHGFVRRDDLTTGEVRLLHILVLGSGGGLGSAFDTVSTDFPSFLDLDLRDSYYWSACSRSDGTIGIVYNAAASGMGSPVELTVAQAASANTPSFTTAVISTGSTDPAYCALAATSTGFLSTWRISTGTTLRMSRYTGSWSAAETLETVDAYYQSALEVTAGVGVVFTDLASGTASPSLFFLIPGAAQTITGVDTFGGESFPSPGYVFIGGSCGTLPTGPGCAGGPAPTTDCRLQGFSI